MHIYCKLLPAMDVSLRLGSLTFGWVISVISYRGRGHINVKDLRKNANKPQASPDGHTIFNHRIKKSFNSLNVS